MKKSKKNKRGTQKGPHGKERYKRKDGKKWRDRATKQGHKKINFVFF